jgi:NADPH:quinone reductase-like Zn-dependent oxidoreductase
VGLVTGAALPLAAVTASQVLDVLDLPSGAQLLVTGVSGVVGGLTAQQAAHRGLHVTGTVRSEGDLTTQRQLGFDRVLTVGQPIPARAFDAVVHTVGSVSVIDAVRDGGRYVSVLTGGAPVPQRGIEPTSTTSPQTRPRWGSCPSVSTVASSPSPRPRP